MEALNLREAASRCGRSVTTLRRYIRRGKLAADKRRGRFGPELFVTPGGLAAAGFETETLVAPAPARGVGRPARAAAEQAVPLTLHQELWMKHEQLLVQYGMMRAAGLRAVELRDELDETRRLLEQAQALAAELRRKLADETARLQRGLRRAELEREGHQIEAEALRERLRALEMVHRNAATSEPIERQFADVMAQSQRVRDLDAELRTGRSDPPADH